MASRKLSKKDTKDKQQLRSLASMFEKRGVTVRREKLSRGSAFRVKSGDCSFSGENIVFVDRRLPLAQQISMLVDYLAELRFSLEDEELTGLSLHTQKLLSSKLAEQVPAS